jgi:hypothetical protein
MFKFSSLLALGASAALALAGCQKSQEAAVQPAAISQDVLAQVKALGFSTTDLKAVEGGYRVEGDILLTPELLANKTDYSMLRVGSDEQYRTTNLVGRLPRTLTVSLSSQFPASYVTAVDEAIRRYNAANLQLHFTRITSGTANLPIKYSSDLGPGVLGQSGGFPQNGEPAPGFTLVPNVIGNQTTNAYSCGGTATNEGASTVGAILIPGTPSSPDPNSWMLACVGNNVSRPFNTNDLTALNYLY